MRIQEQDIYHGAALTQIAEHASFKALNKDSERYGHYLINADCHVFIKYSRSASSPWSFTFTPEQLEPLRNIQESQADLYACFVCGHETVCLLSQEQLEQVIDISAGNSQWVRVEVPKGSSCRVFGSKGKLKKTIPHNAFPANLFG